MRRAPAPALAALALAAGCGRTREGPPPERWLPADASVSLVVPSLGPAARQVGGLYRSVAAIPAAGQAVEAFAAVKAQLGFDPLDVKSLEGAGLGSGGGAGASFAAGRPPLLVLTVSDPGRFDATALRLARDRMGASRRVTSTGAGRQVVSFRRDATGPAALAYTLVGSYALVAAGAGGPAALEAAAGLPDDRSLAKSAAWTAARGAVGSGFPLVAFAPPRSPAAAGLPAARDGAALALRAGPAGAALRLALPLASDRAPGWSALAGDPPGAARKAGVAEARLLSPEAALVARWGGDPSALARKLLPWLPARIKASLDAAGVDIEKDLLPALAPGAALSLAVAPSFALAELSSPALDPRRADPSRLLHVELVLQVRDPAQIRAFSERLARAAPRWGAKLAARGPPGAARAWTLSFGQGRLFWSISAGRLAVAGGAEQLEALEERMAGSGGRDPPAPPEPPGGVGGAVLEVEHLAASIRALPEKAYGTGPDAFVMRALAERLLDSASRLRAVSLRFDLAPGVALFDLEVEGREEAGAK
jgi:hypothetical protein